MPGYIWVIIGVLIIGYFIYLYKKQGKEKALTKLRECIYQLMLYAERNFDEDKGREKLEWVVKQVIEALPDYVEKFIDKEKLVEKVEEFVQNLYNRAKDWLEDGVIGQGN